MYIILYCIYTIYYILYNTLYGGNPLHMKHFIDVITGTIVLIPESTADRQLLYNLMNCSDLTRFPEYLESNKVPVDSMTPELGVPFSEFNGYLEKEQRDNSLIRFTEKKTRGDLDNGESGRLIGFGR